MSNFWAHQINACAPGSSAELDPETCSLLDFADAAYAQSQGLFDISAGVLRRAWDFRAAKIPSSSDIAKLLPLIGWHQMRWQACRTARFVKSDQLRRCHRGADHGSRPTARDG